jgi:hypothetical protein
MNSQEGAVCGSIDTDEDFPPAMCCAIDPNCSGADVGGTSGEDAPDVRVVPSPDHNEGTSEKGEATCGICSRWLMEIAGMLLPAEKLARSRSSALKEVDNPVLRDNCDGGVCQSNEVGVVAMRF